jgi:hypothetical protein
LRAVGVAVPLGQQDTPRRPPLHRALRRDPLGAKQDSTGLHYFNARYFDPQAPSGRGSVRAWHQLLTSRIFATFPTNFFTLFRQSWYD